MFGEDETIFFFPGQPPDCGIQVREGELIYGAALWPICDSIPLCAKEEKEYAKWTKLYLQWNEILGRNVGVPGLDFFSSPSCTAP
jgi:hypothetical protein